MKRKLFLISIYFLLEFVYGFPEDNSEDGGYCAPSLVLQISPATIASFEVTDPKTQIVLGDNKYCSKDLTYTAEVDSKCFPAEVELNGNKYLLFNNSLHDCGIQQKIINESGTVKYQYIATVSKIPDLTADEESAGIGRYNCSEVVFTCNILDENKNASLKPYKPMPNLVEEGSRADAGSVSTVAFSMTESSDGQTVDDTTEVDVGDFIEVKIEYSLGLADVNTTVQMGRCWATPTSNKDDTDSYELIRCDGCAVSVSTETAGQESIQLIANNVQSPSFKYRSFIWRHLDEYSDDQKIWVHCELSACLEDEDNSCPAFEDSKCASSAVCSKKKRSILAAENAISTGGFRVKQKQVTKIEVAHKIGFAGDICSQNNGGCSDKCSLLSNGIAECSCFDGRVLQADRKSCSTQNEAMATESDEAEVEDENVEPDENIELYEYENMELMDSPVVLTLASFTSLTFAIFLFWDLFH